MKKQPDHFTGITFTQWHADTDNLRWCQVEPRFRMLLSVLLNEASNVSVEAIRDGCSEGRSLGRIEGYNQAMEVLRNCGRKQPLEAVLPEATYNEPSTEVFLEKEPLD